VSVEGVYEKRSNDGLYQAENSSLSNLYHNGVYDCIYDTVIHSVRYTYTYRAAVLCVQSEWQPRGTVNLLILWELVCAARQVF